MSEIQATSQKNAPNSKVLRVAIIGASGIGRNHARWFSGHGCEIMAFVGSSPQSVSSTRCTLQSAIDFRGRGYDDVAQMLRDEMPDAVCVSSPPHLHFRHVLQSLEHGAHVLCEKPLVGAEAWSGLPVSELLESAETLVQEARARDRIFATQMQYATCAPQLLDLCDLKSAAEIRAFSMTMETKNLKHGRTFDDIWNDLSPHPLSVLRRFAPRGEIDWTSAHCEIGENQSDARFGLRSENGVIEAQIHVALNSVRAVPERTFEINGQRVEYSARNNENGEFRAYLQSANRVLELPDFVDTLIGNFVRACNGEESLWISGEDGAKVVEWQLKLLEKSQS